MELMKVDYDLFKKILKEIPSNIFFKDTECRYVFSTHYWRHLQGAEDPSWDIAGKTESQVRKIISDNKIRDAIAFQDEASDKNNHFVKLIINGQKRKLNGMGSGANPRTAIGQTADGRILLLVTDGRGANGHLGATASDLIEIMEKYGAVNAANLDGGSSTCMYYNGKWLQNSVTFYYATSSWRIPTAVLVK